MAEGGAAAEAPAIARSCTADMRKTVFIIVRPFELEILAKDGVTTIGQDGTGLQTFRSGPYFSLPTPRKQAINAPYKAVILRYRRTAAHRQ